MNRQDMIDGIPNISASEQDAHAVEPKKEELYAAVSNIDFKNVRSAFGLALHMHQPTIPASSDDLRAAQLISNLQYMMEHPDKGDNHNAPVFLWCYRRMSQFVRELVGQGKNPRIMLDYSGNLLWGLRQIGHGDVLEELAAITSDSAYYRYVEWLGTMWSHAVVSSTPVPDFKLHMTAWRLHFASIFGEAAARRVKGFSPPEMQLPIHPDVCYAYVEALTECGYTWLMVQEHTVENLDGSGIRRPHLPHCLVARNSLGETIGITALVKTKGSDTKLVAQIQPYHEALGLDRQEYAGSHVPPYVLQIGDGENGGVMMNEFPPAYKRDFQGIGADGVVAMNGSEYLEFLKRAGVDRESFLPIQPVSQHLIWNEVDRQGPGAADDAIEKVKRRNPHFDLDRGSWTNDKSWVKNYESVLDPMNRLSSLFHEKFDRPGVDRHSYEYRQALLYLLLSQTSCYRYWGKGIWTDYGKEICRRGMEHIGRLP
jgi:hypothetical protein